MGAGLAVFTLFHVVSSVVGILAGFFVVFGLISAKHSTNRTGTFLVMTAATGVTGFLFPFHKFLPSHGVGMVSILVLALTIPALYIYYLAGAWRHVYVIGAAAALDRDVFVLLAQFFTKIPALKALAPGIPWVPDGRDVDFCRSWGACHQTVSWTGRPRLLSALFNSEKLAVDSS
jgi:hypothetical protein